MTRHRHRFVLRLYLVSAAVVREFVGRDRHRCGQRLLFSGGFFGQSHLVHSPSPNSPRFNICGTCLRCRRQANGASRYPVINAIAPQPADEHKLCRTRALLRARPARHSAPLDPPRLSGCGQEISLKQRRRVICGSVGRPRAMSARECRCRGRHRPRQVASRIKPRRIACRFARLVEDVSRDERRLALWPTNRRPANKHSLPVRRFGLKILPSSEGGPLRNRHCRWISSSVGAAEASAMVED